MACYRFMMADGHLVLTYHPLGSPAVHLLPAGGLLEALRVTPVGVLVDWSRAESVSPALAGQILDLASRYEDLFARGVAFLPPRPHELDLTALHEGVAQLHCVPARVFTERAAAVSWLKAGGASRTNGGRRALSWASRLRQHQREAGALARGALDGDIAAHAAGEVPADR